MTSAAAQTALTPNQWCQKQCRSCYVQHGVNGLLDRADAVSAVYQTGLIQIVQRADANQEFVKLVTFKEKI
jgi:hypothetical protein